MCLLSTFQHCHLIYYHHKSAYTQKDIYIYGGKQAYVKYKIIQFKLKHRLWSWDSYWFSIWQGQEKKHHSKKKKGILKKIVYAYLHMMEVKQNLKHLFI